MLGNRSVLMEKMEKNIYPTEAYGPLSKLLVKLEQELKRGGKKH
jgi:hypothetical protein